MGTARRSVEACSIPSALGNGLITLPAASWPTLRMMNGRAGKHGLAGLGERA